MIINQIDFILPKNNYIDIKTEKSNIIIGNTFNSGMKHFNGWVSKYNGEYKKTAAFTINKIGLVYQHFDPIFYSNFFSNEDLNKKSIVILVENEGYLIKDDKNGFITHNGNIYRGEQINKKWRGYDYWIPYSDEQLNSTAYLVKWLCSKFNIPVSLINHNTKIEREVNYKNIMYRSNIDKNRTDISPTWNFEEFKNKIETI